MLFNSYFYIIIFLPASLIVYFHLNSRKLTLLSKGWLVLASLVFYSWWNIRYLPLILASILFNFVIGSSLSRHYPGRESYRKALLVLGIAGNVGLLGYYKYADFFITNVNNFTGAGLGLFHLALPLGISFFTFTQIAYLVDSHRGKASEYGIMNYALFVTFFPHLIAGPIIHHNEMMPQFNAVRNKVINYRNISSGLFVFSVGLFKKVVIADTFAGWASPGFDTATTLTLIEGWVASLSYTFQIYFDFSGYTDMAIGSALLFNIVLPQNFDSPYKAASVRDFWRRWHMTLSRFLRDYVYIPIGGNRNGDARTCMSIVATFFLGGLWHGAGWTFVIWGLLHGAALVAERLWGKLGIKMNRLVAWFLTFNFICITWVFFRAKDLGSAVRVLKAMFGMSGFTLPESVARMSPYLSGFGMRPDGMPYNLQWRVLIAICFAFILVLFAGNSGSFVKGFRPGYRTLAFGGALAAYSFLNMNRITEFLYFNF